MSKINYLEKLIRPLKVKSVKTLANFNSKANKN